jgi:hypothetical protein
MSEVRLVVRDPARDIQTYCDKDFARCMVAALSAEPETIDELKGAVERYLNPGESSKFNDLSAEASDEPSNRPAVIIDLPARLVASDFLFYEPTRSHERPEPDENEEWEDEALPRLRLSDDWELSDSIADWQTRAEARRAERLATPLFDARAVLYGNPLLEFIARECWETFRDRPPQTVSEDRELEWQTARDEEHEFLRPIHARWMLAPRDDLRGNSPREVMHAKHECISMDIQDRSMQWSHEGTCPRGFDPESAAYRYSGFGTHEMVMYYDLVRHLLWTCRDDVADFVQRHGAVAWTAGDFLASEVPRLAAVREEWLDSPDPEFHGRTPRSIIHNERCRVPEGVSGEEMIIDHDCPLCQMQAELPGPMFWGLDGSNMDDDFAFSIYHRTYEEWEEEQRRHEEFDRRFEAREAERKRLGVECPGGGYADPDMVWKRSFSAAESRGDSVLMRLFAIGSHLTELIVDLKQPNEDRALIDRLSRDFGNLREVAQSIDEAAANSLIEPVVDRFCDTLTAVTAARADLDRKCADLQDRLRRFTDPADEVDDEDAISDLDLPF